MYLITPDEVIEFGGGDKMTTNNKMELVGAIVGLREVKGNEVRNVEVFTDSQYVKKGMTEWIEGWVAKGWKTSTKKEVLNQDLWQELQREENRLKDFGVKVSWKYVPGHSGVPLNERADVIATSYADSIKNGEHISASNLQLYRGLKDDYPYI